MTGLPSIDTKAWDDVKEMKTTSRDANICKCELHMNLFDNLLF